MSGVGVECGRGRGRAVGAEGAEGAWRKESIFFYSLFFFTATQKIEEAIMESHAKTELIKNKFVSLMSEAGVRGFSFSYMSFPCSAEVNSTHQKGFFKE